MPDCSENMTKKPAILSQPPQGTYNLGMSSMKVGNVNNNIMTTLCGNTTYIFTIAKLLIRNPRSLSALLDY